MQGIGKTEEKSVWMLLPSFKLSSSVIHIWSLIARAKILSEGLDLKFWNNFFNHACGKNDFK